MLCPTWRQRRGGLGLVGWLVGCFEHFGDCNHDLRSLGVLVIGFLRCAVVVHLNNMIPKRKIKIMQDEVTLCRHKY